MIRFVVFDGVFILNCCSLTNFTWYCTVIATMTFTFIWFSTLSYHGFNPQHFVASGDAIFESFMSHSQKPLLGCCNCGEVQNRQITSYYFKNWFICSSVFLHKINWWQLWEIAAFLCLIWDYQIPFWILECWPAVVTAVRYIQYINIKYLSSNVNHIVVFS